MMESFAHERKAVFRNLPRVVLITLGCLVALYLASGIHMVDASEMGVVSRFGAHVAIEPPGIGYHLPWPVGAIYKVNVKEVKSLTVGFASDPSSREEIDRYAISGDKNIIHNQYTVQYRTHDAANYLIGSNDVIVVLREMALASILEQVAVRPVDAILTTGKQYGGPRF
jgi:membrane protease subunit HflK